MLIISNITRKYSFSGVIVDLVKDKEVTKDIYDKFTQESKELYFHIIEDKPKVIKQKK
jgi:hypothetical protein